MMTRSTTVRNSKGFSPEVAPWAGVVVAHLLRGEVNSALRPMSDQQLRDVADGIAFCDRSLPLLLEKWGLPPLDRNGFWVGSVLPAIKVELGRRQKPKRVWGADSPIAPFKRVDVAAVAGRFTRLTGKGNRLKGLCPLHDERTPSFYVYGDQGRWRCYGACASGGDVVDLLSQLADKGLLRG